MKLHLFALLAMLVFALAQGVTDKIAPEGDAPAGCRATSDSDFEITILKVNTKDNAMAKKDLALKTRATCPTTGTLVAHLTDTVLTDAQNRTGYIASNYQFQFDNPPQAGALFTAGFSLCGNGSLALGSTTTFWQCASGSFFNLYDRYWAAQCEAVEVVAMPCGERVQAVGDGGEETVVGTQVVTTTVVVPLSDGQPQVVTTTTGVVVCQIGDGQIQGVTTPCTAAQPTPSGPPASQFSDGQVQVTPGPAASQLSDGQVQVTPGPTEPMPTEAMPTVTAPGEQETAPTTSGPAVVPTEAPSAGGTAAAGSIRGQVQAALLVALGVAAVVWV